jgi:hypothetical protein
MRVVGSATPITYGASNERTRLWSHQVCYTSSPSYSAHVPLWRNSNHHKVQGSRGIEELSPLMLVSYPLSHANPWDNVYHEVVHNNITIRANPWVCKDMRNSSDPVLDMRIRTLPWKAKPTQTHTYGRGVKSLLRCPECTITRLIA